MTFRFCATIYPEEVRRVFAPLVDCLTNLSFDEGRFKPAQITPFIQHDGLDITNMANYRPIFNLNTISKVIESLAYWLTGQ